MCALSSPTWKCQVHSMDWNSPGALASAGRRLGLLLPLGAPHTKRKFRKRAHSSQSPIRAEHWFVKSKTLQLKTPRRNLRFRAAMSHLWDVKGKPERLPPHRTGHKNYNLASALTMVSIGAGPVSPKCVR